MHRSTFLPLQHAPTLTSSVDWGLGRLPRVLLTETPVGGPAGLLKKEIQRHTDVEGKFPNRRATRHSADAAPPEKDDDRAAAHRHLTNTNYLDT